ncbi:hypothetical protein [Aquimonas voraii]|uniref:Uncharacterized protein n=1 Tax=Aquimonas voraii TaxID=265719 RepID=A0A1G6WXV2_9GAMM|nr:hypothetical protein [Aquimonas voraii]SDD69825.1 hypothetical protein SAMN04488509_105186 [Aquimonas voraii]
MDGFSGLFLTALVIALLTGKAYFRGVIDRDSQPSDYWAVCGCYLVLGMLMPALGLIKGA